MCFSKTVRGCRGIFKKIIYTLSACFLVAIFMIIMTTIITTNLDNHLDKHHDKQLVDQNHLHDHHDDLLPNRLEPVGGSMSADILHPPGSLRQVSTKEGNLKFRSLSSSCLYFLIWLLRIFL